MQIRMSFEEARKLAAERISAGDVEGAIALYKGLLKSEPENYPLLHLLAVAYMEIGQWEESFFWLEQAGIGLRNELLAMANNRATILGELGKTTDALAVIEQVIRAKPEFAEGYHNRGILRMQQEDYAGALEDYAKALELEPKNANVIFARSFANLVLGNYVDGFRDFEYRKKPDVVIPNSKVWTGREDLTNKTILIHTERGYGDVIQFLRYVPKLVEKAAAVYVAVPPGLQELAASIDGVILLDPEAKITFDYWTFTMSLANCFGISIDNVPPPLSVKLSSTKQKIWDERMPRGKTLNVGLCWAGSPSSKYDKHRTIPLSKLLPLFDIEGARFYSFQQVPRDGDRDILNKLLATNRIVDLAPFFDNYYETMHALNNLDLMISCDTSIVHAAGSLAVPTWVLLTKFRTYWLWLKDRSTTPWYPSVKFFRQEQDGHWESVVHIVAQDLQRWVNLRNSIVLAG